MNPSSSCADLNNPDLVRSITRRCSCNRPCQPKPYQGECGSQVTLRQTHAHPCWQINALIVENTFTSLPGVVRGWPVIGIFSFICLQKWNSASKLPRIPKALPILMLSGDRDEVVPRKHMHTLWEIATKRGRKDKGSNEQSDVPPSMDVFKSFEYGGHSKYLFTTRFGLVVMYVALANTDHQAGYWNAIEEFLAGLSTTWLRLTFLGSWV